MQRFAAVCLIGSFACASGAFAAGDPLPKTGSVKHVAYSICRSVGAADLGEFGSNTSAECSGIVKNRDGGKLLDNLAMSCLEESVARKEGYKYIGTCIETDADGDKLYLGYEGKEDGELDLIGGTGKFKGMKGKGKWTVTDAPGNTAAQFGFTLDYDFSWSFD